MNRAELLERMRTGRAQLDSALAALTDDQMTATSLPNQWSVKDVLAHLGWWERRVVDIYQSLLQSDKLDAEAEDLPIDEQNARVFAANHQRPLAEVRREEEEAYRDILAVAETAPEADLFDSQRFAEAEGRAFYEWIRSNTYEHYEEHLRDFSS